MNGNHVRPKLKIRNRVLAIFVAFLLLSLMIPNAVFATESTDANLNDAAKEVNNEAENPVADVPSNITITGVVQNASLAGVDGVSVSAYKSGNRVCMSVLTSGGGNFSLSLDASVSENDPILIMANPESGSNYAFEVYATKADNTSKTITLQPGVNTTVKTVDSEVQQDHLQILTTVNYDGGTERSEQNLSGATPFNYIFPVGGIFMMDSHAVLHFHYLNSASQSIDVTITGVPTDYYRAYYWGFSVNGAVPGELMTIDEPYTLETGNTYTIGLAYVEQIPVNFISESENHDHFHLMFYKNDVLLQDKQVPAFPTTINVKATCTLKEDGTLQMYYNDSDVANKYVINAYIAPVAKAGYKHANWTYKGEVLKTGDVITFESGNAYEFKANYEVDASTAPATGDINFVWIIALSGLALASAAGALRFRKNH